MKNISIRLLGNCIQLFGILVLILSLLPYINPGLFEKTRGAITPWSFWVVIGGIAISTTLIWGGWIVPKKIIKKEN